jgi:hypothetical protein
VSLLWPLKSLNSRPNSIPKRSENGRFWTVTTIPSIALRPLRSEQTLNRNNVQLRIYIFIRLKCI